MTSFTKVWVVVSLIRPSTACGTGPLPCSTIVTGFLAWCPVWLRHAGDLGPVRIARPICGVFALFPGVAGHGCRPQVPAFRGLLHSWAAFGIALTVAGAPI